MYVDRQRTTTGFALSKLFNNNQARTVQFRGTLTWKYDLDEAPSTSTVLGVGQTSRGSLGENDSRRSHSPEAGPTSATTSTAAKSTKKKIAAAPNNLSGVDSTSGVRR
uniref:Uncharacterized protein n=1 Tax=Mycena chlorophos TaxID=658473 RepID=A0ABQ0KW21_MYCCL|nr:predicted protein [Mycena chlorophos]